MQAELLLKILERTGAFQRAGRVFTLSEGFEASVHAAKDSFEATVTRIKEITVEDDLTVLASSAEGASTTLLETSSVVAVTVRGAARGEKKRAGFS